MVIIININIPRHHDDDNILVHILRTYLTVAQQEILTRVGEGNFSFCLFNMT